MPNLPPIDTRNFFFDLTDPAKRSSQDLLEVLKVISRWSGTWQLLFRIRNYNEALQFVKLELMVLTRLKKVFAQYPSPVKNCTACAWLFTSTESAACATKMWCLVDLSVLLQKTPNTTKTDHFNAGFISVYFGFSPLTSLALVTCTSGYYGTFVKVLYFSSHFLL